jgi:hypothetical protein
VIEISAGSGFDGAYLDGGRIVNISGSLSGLVRADSNLDIGRTYQKSAITPGSAWLTRGVRTGDQDRLEWSQTSLWLVLSFDENGDADTHRCGMLCKVPKRSFRVSDNGN